MQVDEAIDALFTDPSAFLERNYVTIAGGNERLSQLSIFRIQKQTMSFALQNGVNVVSKRQKWMISVRDEHPGRVLSSGEYGDGPYSEFRAYYVAMRQMAEGLDTTHFTLPQDGPDLMLTSQLSGCTFGHGSQARGGACIVSHLQPTAAGAAADNPAMRVQSLGGLGADGGRVFQRYVDYTDRATVVGHRTAGIWHFYTQLQVNRELSGVREI